MPLVDALQAVAQRPPRIGKMPVTRASVLLASNGFVSGKSSTKASQAATLRSKRSKSERKVESNQDKAGARVVGG